MPEDNKIRLSKAAKEFNVGMSTIAEFLAKKGYTIDPVPNTKLSEEMYQLLVKEYIGDKEVKKEANRLGDLSFKGGNVTVDTTIIDKKANEDEEEDEDMSDFLIRFPSMTNKAAKKRTPAPVEKSEQPAKEAEKEPEKQDNKVEDNTEPTNKVETVKILGKIDLDSINSKTKPAPKTKEQKSKEAKERKAAAEKEHQLAKQTQKQAEQKKQAPEQPKKQEPAPAKPEPKPVEEKKFIKTEVRKIEGPKILDKIELPDEHRSKGKQQPAANNEKGDKKKRKRIKVESQTPATPQGTTPNKQGKQQNAGPKEQKQFKKGKNKFAKPIEKVELSDEEIQKQIKDTLARLSPMGKSKTSKHRREKRHAIAENLADEMMQLEESRNTLKLTEFVTANELATMMNIPVTKVIATCMSLGMFVSINQRLDAEILSIVAEEFGFNVEFVSADVHAALEEKEEEDNEEDLVERAPIVTVMGHVDHGKTKLLDYIRHTNVVAGEAGGITQHIGAYEVRTESGKKITFLDTPGHEAFTAMRARGASITDVAIIVIAADDSVMPQTIEAINHAQAASVPIVFAINKIDKPTANPQKIYEQLANMNILVEEWGGKYQSQEIAAKTGLNVDKLLDKVILEADMLELKGNPNKRAKGTIIESALDKGRGYVAKALVQDGTMRIGDIVLAGSNYGKVKAMFNERNQQVKEAGPSTPVLLLGLNGAPQAGDPFNVLEDEREAKDIANRRTQLRRELGMRTQKHITLDEIGRRIAIGDFKELNIIVKADVDGSVEALSDSLLKLSTEEVQVNVIHKAVGAISESDISLASASNAVIVGFNVRPTVQARKLAESEQIDIRLYSIIYTAIEELKAAIEGMLSPEIEEVNTCNVEIRETFKISKVGTIAGCYVIDGKVTRNTKIRVIRDGIVVHTGTLGSLKRYKDDVKEVGAGMECGLNIENYNDIKVGDIIEGYEVKEISRKL